MLLLFAGDGRCNRPPQGRDTDWKGARKQSPEQEVYAAVGDPLVSAGKRRAGRRSHEQEGRSFAGMQQGKNERRLGFAGDDR